MKRKLSAVAVALLVGLPAGAWAIGQLVGVGVEVWARELSATTTSACFTQRGESGLCALFGAGQAKPKHLITVFSSDAATCCWTLDSDNGDIATMQIVGGTHGGTDDCFRLQANASRWDTRPSWNDLTEGDSAGNGQIIGVCDTSTTVAGENGVHAPCRRDGDCTPWVSGSSCDLTPSANLRRKAGAFLRCEADATASLYLSKQAIFD